MAEPNLIHPEGMAAESTTGDYGFEKLPPTSSLNNSYELGKVAADEKSSTVTDNKQVSVEGTNSLLPEKNSCCKWSEHIHPKVVDLIYWKDYRLTGAVFLSSFIFLLSLALFSVLSVLAYLLLITLTVTLTFRFYKNILAAIQKTGEGNPFKKYLELDIGLDENKTKTVTTNVVKHGSALLTELRRLILIEDIVDSLKFGLFLWVLTYVGAWFNGMTIVILVNVAIFTIPKFYDVYKVEINKYFDLVKRKVQEVTKLVTEKMKTLGKKKTQ